MTLTHSLTHSLTRYERERSLADALDRITNDLTRMVARAEASASTNTITSASEPDMERDRR